jgi:hypothetical protein
VTVLRDGLSQALVAHTSNPSYSGGSWFKASRGKQLLNSYLKKKKKKERKRACEAAQGASPEFKP